MNVIRKTLLWLLRPVVLLLTTAFGLLLPNRGKRIIFAASLYTHLNRVDPSQLDQTAMAEYLDELNRLFQLTGREHRALLMPLMLHELIWGDVDLPDNERLTKQTVQSNCEVLLKRIPQWLKYDRKVMRDDASLIVRRCAGRHLRLQS